MKRLHVHLKVNDLEQSANFYTALFGREPVRRESDYAKWMLDEPAANIAISTRGCGAGIDHLGVQLDDDDSLAITAERLHAAQANMAEEPNAACCYARSNKHWAQSPDGVRWELFHTFGDSAQFGNEPSIAIPNGSEKNTMACCGG